MSTLFNSTSIHFEKSPVLLSDAKLPLSNPAFGVFKFQAIKIDCPDKYYHIVYSIDRSGSMSDRCSDGRTKQQHILHTLKNMCWYFHDHPTIYVRVSIFIFDCEVEQILDKEIITCENIQEIIKKIDLIRPKGSTDIGSALQTVNDFIKDIRTCEVNSEINHIFMTDGDATYGELNPIFLKTYVDTSYTNVFVGFGIEHNDAILSELSSQPNTSYYFIDKLENSGLVYGEILHSLLYKLLVKTEIIIDNGLLYDFNTDTWVNKLYIGDVVGESNKVYHIISENPNECNIQIYAKKFTNRGFVFITVNNQTFEDNLTCYMFRQKTLQLLHEVKEFSKKEIKNLDNLNKYINVFDFIDGSACVGDDANDANDANDGPDNNVYLKQEIKNKIKNEIKNKMKELMGEMKKYMKVNDLEDDKFMKNLCDDIYISYRTFGTIYSGMYTNARLTSQATQRCYTVSDTPIAEIPDTFDTHQLSNFDDTPYSTSVVLELMRSVSDGNDNFAEPLPSENSSLCLSPPSSDDEDSFM